MTNIGIVIQARTGSSRLPNKMLKPFYSGAGILELILSRIKNFNLGIPLILATSNNKLDDKIEEVGNKLDITTYRGSENNVLSRFIDVGEKYNFNKIIRVCADNPFLDIYALKQQVLTFYNKDVDYCAYSLSDKTPTIKTHYGFWTEGVSLSTLNEINKLTQDMIYQEHVTNYIYTHPNDFKIHLENIPNIVNSQQNIRLTIDTMVDFELAQKIYKNVIDKNITMTSSDIVKYLIKNPNYFTVMENEINNNKK